MRGNARNFFDVNRTDSSKYSLRLGHRLATAGVIYTTEKNEIDERCERVGNIDMSTMPKVRDKVCC